MKSRSTLDLLLFFVSTLASMLGQISEQVVLLKLDGFVFMSIGGSIEMSVKALGYQGQATMCPHIPNRGNKWLDIRN